MRRLTVMALRRADQAQATAIGNQYVAGLPRPYSAKDAEFIVAITRTSKDLGFGLMQQHPQEFNAAFGSDIAGRRIKEILERERLQQEKAQESASSR